MCNGKEFSRLIVMPSWAMRPGKALLFLFRTIQVEVAMTKATKCLIATVGLLVVLLPSHVLSELAVFDDKG